MHQPVQHGVGDNVRFYQGQSLPASKGTLVWSFFPRRRKARLFDVFTLAYVNGPIR